MVPNLRLISISLAALVRTLALPVSVSDTQWYTHSESVYMRNFLNFHWSARLTPFITASSSARLMWAASFVGRNQQASSIAAPFFFNSIPESSHPPTRSVRLPVRTNLLLRGHPALPLRWSPSPCEPTDRPLFHCPSLWWLHLLSFLWCLLPLESIHTLVGAPQVYHTGRRQLVSWRHRVLQELQFRAPTSRSPAPVERSRPKTREPSSKRSGSL